MSMAERKTMTRAVKNPVKRKLTRAEKKEIAAVIQAAKGDGKPHTAQQTIPYLQMYPDGICRVTEKKYSKSLVFEDINYQLAQADDKTAIIEGTLERTAWDFPPGGRAVPFLLGLACTVRAYHKGLYRPVLVPFWRRAHVPHGAKTRCGIVP